MVSSEERSTPPHYDEAEFARDLAELRPQALREKYPREASCHANTKRRCKSGDWEFAQEWEDFRTFLRDMGPVPSADATLDRIDPSVRRYGPGLVRWATKKDQTVNRTNTRWVELRGERMTLQEFADRLGSPYTTVHAALGRGETPDQIASRKERGASQGHYRPDRLRDDDGKFAEWRAGYERWLRRVRRDRRPSAPPEIYEIMIVSYALDGAERRLDSGGYYELTPDEYPEAASRWSDEARIVKNAPDWIAHARASLAQRDPALASRFVTAPGWTYRDFWRFQNYLDPPPED